MKTKLLLFSSLFLITGSISAETSAEIHKEGIKLVKEGKITEGLAKLKSASDLSPNVAFYLNDYIKISGNKESLIQSHKLNQLKKIKIASVDFQNMTFSNALRELSNKVVAYNDENGTSLNSNFIIRDSSLNDKKLNLKLSNVPLKAVLDNMVLLVKASYKVEEYVISFNAK